INNIYLYEGDGRLNDLWEYDISTNQWKWVAGSKNKNAEAVMNEKGVAHPDNTPGSRFGACMTEDLNGNLWLFGGEGNAISGGQGLTSTILLMFLKVNWQIYGCLMEVCGHL